MQPSPDRQHHHSDHAGQQQTAQQQAANRALLEKFCEHDVQREYTVCVLGAFPEDARTVSHPIDGRAATTHFEVAERLGERATLLGARLETGRTHQIRLHCRHLGHPVMGDGKYGTRSGFDPPRMALHAATLAFRHPRTGELEGFESPLPKDLADWLERLREEP